MTPVECVDLVEFIADRCPAMKMRDGTPEAWYLDLVNYDLADALEAARRATLDKTFIGIGDLVRECETIVRHRLGEQRQAQRAAQIAAENHGDTDPQPVTTGGPAIPLAIEAAPLNARLDLYQEGRRVAAQQRREREEAERRVAEAKAERAARRQQILAELEPLRATSGTATPTGSTSAAVDA